MAQGEGPPSTSATDLDRLRDAARRVERYTGELWYGTPQLRGKTEAVVREIRAILGGVRDLLNQPPDATPPPEGGGSCDHVAAGPREVRTTTIASPA
jgi:hypothetical protein